MKGEKVTGVLTNEDGLGGTRSQGGESDGVESLEVQLGKPEETPHSPWSCGTKLSVIALTGPALNLQQRTLWAHWLERRAA